MNWVNRIAASFEYTSVPIMLKSIPSGKALFKKNNIKPDAVSATVKITNRIHVFFSHPADISLYNYIWCSA